MRALSWAAPAAPAALRCACAAGTALERLGGAAAPALRREPGRTLARAAAATLAFRALPGSTGLPLWAEAAAALAALAAAEALLGSGALRRMASGPPSPHGGIPSTDWDLPDPGIPSTQGDASRARARARTPAAQGARP